MPTLGGARWAFAACFLGLACTAARVENPFDYEDDQEVETETEAVLEDDLDDDRFEHHLLFGNLSLPTSTDHSLDDGTPVEALVNGVKPVCVGLDLEGNCMFLNPLGSSTKRRSLRAGKDGTGDMPGVDMIADGGNTKYFSEMCKTPPTKMNPPDFDYLNFGGEVVTRSARPLQAEDNSGSVSSSARKLLAQRKQRQSRKARRGKGAVKLRIPGWGEGHPNKRDYELFDWATKNREGFCPYANKACIKPDTPGETEIAIQGPAFPCCQKKDKSCCTRKKFIVTETEPMPRSEWEGLPSIERGRWGSCAYVALGDNLLRKENGKEIENHDLVIRLGHSPIGKFAKYVGTRTDVVVSRGASTRMQKKDAHGDVKFYIGATPVYFNASALKHWVSDYPPIKAGDLGERISPRLLAGQVYKQMTSPLGTKPRGPTTGYIMALNFLYAGFCSRLDFYGFSSNGGPAYFGGGGMKIHHSCELESWSFHHLMKNKPELNMCVYV